MQTAVMPRRDRLERLTIVLRWLLAIE